MLCHGGGCGDMGLQVMGVVFATSDRDAGVLEGPILNASVTGNYGDKPLRCRWEYMLHYNRSW